MFKLDYDILVERRAKQLAAFTEEQRRKIDDDIDVKYMVRVKHAKKPTFADGDIFVLSPEEGKYFYGRILQAKIESKEGWYDECVAAFVFKNRTKEKSITDFKLDDYTEIIKGPILLHPCFWTGGICETVGNIPLTKKEKKLDYGFFKRKPLGVGGTFVSANGKVLNHIPKYFNGYGVTTQYGLKFIVREALILEPELLNF